VTRGQHAGSNATR